MTTVARTADELTEALGDTTSLREIVKSPESLHNYITEYAKQQARTDDSIAQQVREETQKAFADCLRGDQIENINRVNLAPDGQPVARSKHYNGKAPGAKLDQQFGNWTEYMSAVWDGAKTQESFTAQADLKRLQNTFGSTVPSDGGFLIPETLRSELLRVSLEQSLVRSRARVVPMETLMVPYPMVDSTSNASTVHGGIVGYWTEEGGSLTDSSPTFGRIELQAKKLTLYSEIPNELFQDSLATLQQFMSESYPEALAWFEDIAFIEGNGVGQPTGFLNAQAAVSVAKETGQAAATILWENVVKAYSRMLPASIGRAVWVAHIDTFPELATMALSVGTGGSAVWVGNGDGAGAPPMTILGRPVIFTEKVPQSGSAGQLAFVDFGYYLIGDRQIMQASSSAHYKFANDTTAFRIIERVDGRPWLNSAITPKNGSATLSPFVELGASQ